MYRGRSADERHDARALAGDRRLQQPNGHGKRHARASLDTRVGGDGPWVALQVFQDRLEGEAVKRHATKQVRPRPDPWGGTTSQVGNKGTAKCLCGSGECEVPPKRTSAPAFANGHEEATNRGLPRTSGLLAHATAARGHDVQQILDALVKGEEGGGAKDEK